MADALEEELAAVQRLRREARRRRYRRSRLERFRAEIERLAARGASLADIALWLRQFRRTRVHRSTVGRMLARWRNAAPECPE